jgi:hypothetical protein
MVSVLSRVCVRQDHVTTTGRSEKPVDDGEDKIPGASP